MANDKCDGWASFVVVLSMFTLVYCMFSILHDNCIFQCEAIKTTCHIERLDIPKYTPDININTTIWIVTPQRNPDEKFYIDNVPEGYWRGFKLQPGTYDCYYSWRYGLHGQCDCLPDF